MVNLWGIKVCSGSEILMMLRPSHEFVCEFFSFLNLGAVPILLDSGLCFRKFFIYANA
jgi:acyl-CoA synthetase (AMP-forming)/AMP-acid ligase II